MNDTTLKKLVATAIALDQAIEAQKKELAEVEKQLKTEAFSRSEEHTATDGGGWSWTFEADGGAIVRVTQEGKKLKGKIEAEEDVGALRKLAGALFDRLFKPAIVYKPVDNVREEAKTLLGTKAAALLKAISGKGSVKVAYETREKAAA